MARSDTGTLSRRLASFIVRFVFFVSFVFFVVNTVPEIKERLMRRWRWAMAALVAAAALAMPAGTQAQPAGGMPPMMMGGSKPSPQTVALQKKAQQLEAQYKKKPNSKLKSQLAEADYQYGHALMMDNALAPRVKYRQSLTELRKALKLNPNHKKAREDKDLIEGIYRQMGRPIPQ